MYPACVLGPWYLSYPGRLLPKQGKETRLEVVPDPSKTFVSRVLNKRVDTINDKVKMRRLKYHTVFTYMSMLLE